MEINQASDNWMVILLDSVWVIRIFQVFKIVFLLFFQVASLTRFDPQCTRLLCIFRAISAPDLFNNFNLKLPSNYAYHRAKSDCISLCMDKWWVLLKNQRFRVILMHESPLKQNHPLNCIVTPSAFFKKKLKLFMKLPKVMVLTLYIRGTCAKMVHK